MPKESTSQNQTQAPSECPSVEQVLLYRLKFMLVETFFFLEDGVYVFESHRENIYLLIHAPKGFDDRGWVWNSFSVSCVGAGAQELGISAAFS